MNIHHSLSNLSHPWVFPKTVGSPKNHHGSHGSVARLGAGARDCRTRGVRAGRITVAATHAARWQAGFSRGGRGQRSNSPLESLE